MKLWKFLFLVSAGSLLAGTARADTRARDIVVNGVNKLIVLNPTAYESEGVAPALTGSRIAVTGGPADQALSKVGGPDGFVQLAQNWDPRIPVPSALTASKKKALPRTPPPPPPAPKKK